MQEPASSLLSDDVSLCSSTTVFDNSHRIASTDFDGIQNGRIDEMEMSTNLPISTKEVIRRIRAESSSLKAVSKSTAFSEAANALNMVPALSPAQKGRDVTTTVYSGDYYSQLQKRQDEISKQTLLHDTEADALTPVVEANVNSSETSRQLEHITTSSSTSQKEPASSLLSDDVSLCSSTTVFDNSHRIASTDFDGIQNGRIDEMEMSTNLPISSMLFYAELFLVVVFFFS
ncbi:hypothetical protein WUBG_14779 [Wuchereria bancrofti]|uniref:Uncharacterized protein n=1 Tax=Wuchereria bancrofti TaxID=6293 RepID=J9AJD7_WUCBA|nr:hypothetical protein WUBG_14779 [Wuchereria bancrofti]